MSPIFSATAFVVAIRAGEFAFYGAVLYAFSGKGMLLLAGTASSDMQTLSFSKFHVEIRIMTAMARLM